MKMNDKVIIAFLVSMGLFSAGQTTQYVETLSKKEKVSLVMLNKNSDNITVADRSPETGIGHVVEVTLEG